MPADTLPPEVQRDLDAMDAAVAGAPHESGDAVLAELAALLATDRPTPDPQWARRLDARAAKGFAKPPRRPRFPRAWLGPAAGLAATAALIAIVAIVPHHGTETASSGGGVSSSDSGGSNASGGSSSAASQAAPAAPAPGVTAEGVTRDRKVERSATMRLGAPRRDLDAVADGVARVTTQLGGFVASSNLSSREGGELDLRVPAGRLDDAIARLSRLGHVRRLERSTLDITAQAVSARTRIADLKAERRSLLHQLADSTTLEQTNRLRDRLTAVNRRLQAARASARRIATRAALASLSVELVPERAKAAATGGGGWSPGDAWHDALRVLEVAAGIALVAFAVALPLLLLGVPAWLATRRLNRTRRERALDLA
jgi:Domain of unknown function (DUF4349)